MPINVIVENFTTEADAMYLFNELPDEIFGDVPNQYQITKSITFIGNTNIKVCPNVEKNRKMASIKVEYK